MKITPVGRKFGRYQPGEVFELPDRASKVLIKLGKVAAYEEAAVEAPVKQALEPEISERTGLPKRQYRRRDMAAEE